MEQIKILELFGGIGACSKAFKRARIPYKVVDYVEIDKYAVASYNAINNTNFEPQDITTYDKDIDVDLIMHGSPCQDFSIAGLQKGGDKGTGTRSSLMWNTVDIVEKVKPKYIIWENVKNLLGTKHKHNFDSYIEIMNKLGYNSYYKILNAKDYGIPQNRERVFTISIRKDIDSQNFVFPEKQELKLKLKDLLEKKVDEKYYLSNEAVQGLKRQELLKHKPNYIEDKEVANTIDTKVGSGTHFSPYLRENKCIQVGKLDIKDMDCVKRVYSSEDLVPTVKENYDTVTAAVMQGRYNSKGETEQKIEVSGQEIANAITTVQKDSMVQVKEIKPILNSQCKRLKKLVDNTTFKEGEVLNMDLYNQSTNKNISQTLTEPHHNTQRLFDGYRIRKLTPKECWRLMGFDDEDFIRAKNVGISDTQLYKQAGNSIVVNVLEKILINLFGDDSKKTKLGIRLW